MVFRFPTDDARGSELLPIKLGWAQLGKLREHNIMFDAMGRRSVVVIPEQGCRMAIVVAQLRKITRNC